MTISELDHGELSTLGPNIHRLDNLLTRYWQERFSDDPLHRIHLVYFFESPFDHPPTRFHLHLHLIPRTSSLGRLLREYPNRNIAAGSPHGLNAWRTPTLTASELFPAHYRRTESNSNVLMTWLRGHFPAA
jgi:hypothetical protein